MTGAAISTYNLTLLSLFCELPIIQYEDGCGKGFGVIWAGDNNIKMSTLPMIHHQMKRSRAEYLRFPTVGEEEGLGQSLEQQTHNAVSHRNYLYIDFQAGDRVLELEQVESAGEEAQQIGNSRIGGFQQLSRVSPSAYCMHKYLSEEQLYMRKKEKWSSLIRRRAEDGEINFHRVRQQLNPEKLQDYLQKKHNENSWRKIHDRQQKLLLDISQPQIPSILAQPRSLPRPKPKQQPRGLRLKALDRLNVLLQNP